jgi:hypothetical protein
LQRLNDFSDVWVVARYAVTVSELHNTIVNGKSAAKSKDTLHVIENTNAVGTWSMSIQYG